MGDGPLSPEINTVAIEVPDTACPLTPDNCTILRNEVNPLDETTVHGIDIYQKALAFVVSVIGN